MAAVFHYNEQYVDDEMDIDSLTAHLDYIRDNPPAGTMLKLFFDSFGDKNKEIEDDSPPEVSNSLEDFIADFTGAGGDVK